eukprot:9496504-Pyramimonas_sp.AAC.1
MYEAFVAYVAESFPMVGRSRGRGNSPRWTMGAAAPAAGLPLATTPLSFLAPLMPACEDGADYRGGERGQDAERDSRGIAVRESW